MLLSVSGAPKTKGRRSSEAGDFFLNTSQWVVVSVMATDFWQTTKQKNHHDWVAGSLFAQLKFLGIVFIHPLFFHNIMCYSSSLISLLFSRQRAACPAMILRGSVTILLSSLSLSKPERRIADPNKFWSFQFYYVTLSFFWQLVIANGRVTQMKSQHNHSVTEEQVHTKSIPFDFA